MESEGSKNVNSVLNNAHYYYQTFYFDIGYLGNLQSVFMEDDLCLVFLS